MIRMAVQFWVIVLAAVVHAKASGIGAVVSADIRTELLAVPDDTLSR
jgi:hypothetical protein